MCKIRLLIRKPLNSLQEPTIAVNVDRISLCNRQVYNLTDTVKRPKIWPSTVITRNFFSTVSRQSRPPIAGVMDEFMSQRIKYRESFFHISKEYVRCPKKLKHNKTPMGSVPRDQTKKKCFGVKYLRMQNSGFKKEQRKKWKHRLKKKAFENWSSFISSFNFLAWLLYR